MKAAIEGHGSLTKKYHITNTDRSSFARVSGAIAARYGDAGFRGTLRFELHGGAGQSFCAFLGRGMEVTLVGYANDYVGKCMAGGKVTVLPPPNDLKAGNLHELTVGRSVAQYSMVGNTVLYGATGGNLYVRGRAGERCGPRHYFQ